jgi:hypothetical protein
MKTAIGRAVRLRAHFASCVALSAGIGSANAEVIAWQNCNLIVPNTIDGLYINVEARTTGSAGSAVAGWDINPYSATNLTWFNATGTGMMRFPGVTAGSAGSLDLGTSIGPSGSFGSGAVVVGTSPGNWRLNSVNYFGFRFVAADGGTRYGYGTFQIGSSISGADRTITNLYYESVAGAPIVVSPARHLPTQQLALPSSTSGTISNEPGPVRMFAADGSLWTLVGLPLTDSGSATDSGSIRVVRFTASGGMVESDLLSPSPSAGDQFGSGLGTDGTTLAVVSGGTGTLRIFRREGTNFVLSQTIPSLVTPGGLCQVAVAGGRIVVPDPGANSASGRVRVLSFVSGSWSVTNVLSAPTPINGRALGGGLYATASRIVASEATNPTVGCIGRAFEFNMNNLAAAPIELPAPTGTSGCSLFGTGVTGTDGIAAVRARDDSANGSTSGSVIVYERSATGWTQVLRAGPSISASNREWGYGGVDGSRVFAGAEAVYTPASVFTKLPSGWALTNVLELPQPEPGLMRHGTIFRDTVVMPILNGSSCRLSVFALRDCNSNLLGDESDIAAGLAQDFNANNVPDTCECAASPSLPACCLGNINGDAVVDGSDLGLLLSSWGTCGSLCPADLNRDGFVNGADLGVLLNEWGSCTN